MENSSLAVYRPRDEEEAQALTRIYFGLIGLFFFIFLSFQEYFQAPLQERLAYLLNGVFLLIAAAHLFAVRTLSAAYALPRKIFAIEFDIATVTVVMWVLGDISAIVAPLYLWVIIGNGIRFGSAFLIIAMLSSLLSMLIVSLYHPYWHANWQITAGLCIAIVILPLFYLKLIRRLHTNNHELERLLKLTQHQAHHDILTGLPNRTLFYETLQLTVESAQPFALLFIDLDGFKKVNDRYGHESGDALLLQVADRIRHAAGRDHFAARLGGDEFVLILPMKPRRLQTFAQNLLVALARPYDHRPKITTVSASIGISLYPDDTEDPFYLKRYADRAMYKAKYNGKNRFLFWKDITH